MPEAIQDLSSSEVWIVTAPPNLNIEREVIEIRSDVILIIDGAFQGAPGPPGQNAEGSLDWRSEQFLIASDGDQNFTLAEVPKLGSVFVSLNGLNEGHFFLADDLVSLDDVNTIAGDGIVIRYQVEV